MVPMAAVIRRSDDLAAGLTKCGRQVENFNSSLGAKQGKWRWKLASRVGQSFSQEK